VQLAASLNTILAARKLTQAEAARVLGVNQPKVSALKGYKLEGFSVERLMHFATALQHDVVIEIRPRAATIFVALLRERLRRDGAGYDDMEGHFRAHLNRGVVLLQQRVRSVADLANLVPSARGKR
jgi:predicted XRE-type DNA-binding protein